MTKSLTAVLLLLTLISSCSNNDRQNDGALHSDTTSNIIPKPDNYDTLTHVAYLKFDKDSVIILPFEIEVSLSPKAKDKIISSKETIIINVSLTGTPKDTTLFSEDGQFYVASAEKEITYGQVARFDNIKFSKKMFDQLTDKDVYLNAFAYSGRKSSPNNLLNCDIVADSISKIVNKRFTIIGKLIYSDD